MATAAGQNGENSSEPARPGTVRLVVPSPDGTRVLARPNGLAGWALPAIAVMRPMETWSPEAADAAEAVLGTAVEPVRRLEPSAWVVGATGRITSAGNTWIGVDEAARFGADETVVRAWAEDASSPDDGHPPARRRG